MTRTAFPICLYSVYKDNFTIFDLFISQQHRRYMNLKTVAPICVSGHKYSIAHPHCTILEDKQKIMVRYFCTYCFYYFDLISIANVGPQDILIVF